jgi:hypothetical protein
LKLEAVLVEVADRFGAAGGIPFPCTTVTPAHSFGNRLCVPCRIVIDSPAVVRQYCDISTCTNGERLSYLDVAHYNIVGQGSLVTKVMY